MLTPQDVYDVTATPSQGGVASGKIFGWQKRREFAANGALQLAAEFPGLTEEFRELWSPRTSDGVKAETPQYLGRVLTRSCVFAMCASTAFIALTMFVA